jgi:hypothetical protein
MATSSKVRHRSRQWTALSHSRLSRQREGVAFGRRICVDNMRMSRNSDVASSHRGVSLPLPSFAEASSAKLAGLYGPDSALALDANVAKGRDQIVAGLTSAVVSRLLLSLLRPLQSLTVSPCRPSFRCRWPADPYKSSGAADSARPSPRSTPSCFLLLASAQDRCV